MRGRTQRDEKGPKRSGCKSGTGPKFGKPYLSGWRLRYGVMVGILAFPYEGTQTHDGQNHQWENWVAKVTKDGVPEQGVVPCLYDVTTGKVIIKSMGIVMNPKAPNGGYCGTFKKS